MDASIRLRSAILTLSILSGLFLILYFTCLKTMIPSFPELLAGDRIIDIGMLDVAAGQSSPISKVFKESNTAFLNTNPVHQENVAKQDFEDAPVIKINGEAKLTTQNVEMVDLSPMARNPNQAAMYPGRTTSNSKELASGLGNKGKGKVGTIGNKGEPESREIPFILPGRKLTIKPFISDHSQETGKVVVEITVNNKGDVTYANPGARGTTTSSSLLFKLAKDAAMQAKFSKSDGADIQRGTITFVFVVQ